MANTIEVKVPDIGNYSDVPVIEVLVKPGDTVAKDQSLVTLESDKATMEVPASAAGVVKEVRVKVNDTVSEGDVVVVVEATEAATPSKAAPQAASPPRPLAGEAAAQSAAGEGKRETASQVPPSPQPSPASGRGGAATSAAPVAKGAPESGRKADIECQVVVLGSGPGGYTAAFRAADLGQNTVLIERYVALGGVCLNVGCIPSKALLHAARVIDEAAHASDYGVAFGEPKIDLAKLRAYKDKVVAQMVNGLAGMSKQRKVTRRRRHRQVHLAARDRSRDEGRQEARPFRESDHRRRLASREAARLSVGRQAHDGFDRCARARRDPEETPRRRRRHHRPRDGVRVRCARQRSHGRRAARSADAGRRSRISCVRCSSVSPSATPAFI